MKLCHLVPFASAVLSILPAIEGKAQIVPDRTLGSESSVVNQIDALRQTIDGGAVRGSNLFHSFSEFNVPTGGEAFFNNGGAIDNIITRVTGRNFSNIDGLIGANGNANLFLINPNGILFGPNARLDIGGSFFASTADRLLFSDRTFYSATQANTPSLLTINVPIGLQWNGTNAGNIRVEGAGHNLTFQDFNGLVLRGESLSSLQVRSGNTLALIGGNITLEGATLSAPSGRIELGSVTEGTVTLLEDNNNGNWRLGYEEAFAFGDIQLVSQAAADASGTGDGSIQVRGQNLTLADGSVLLIQNQGSQPTGSIAVDVTESVQLIGTTAELSPFLPNAVPSVRMPSGLQTQTIGEVNGADIEISAQRLSILEGAAIETNNFSSTDASAGDIRINTSDSVTLIGDSPVFDLVISLINSTSMASGSMGDIIINTDRLRILDGAAVGSASFNGNRTGGNLTVNATESVEIVGFREEDTSSLGVIAIRGRAGNLLVNTTRLLLQDAATIFASSFDDGSGSIEINASQEVSISGTAPQSSQGASLSASVFIFRGGEALRIFAGISEVPNGDSGSVRINSPLVRLSDKGQIAVTNEGTGRGGNLEVISQKLVLDNGGQITAATASGEGGNIILQVGDSLQLHRQSLLSAEAEGTGNGGNITINADTLALLENSRITANAIEGNGGNIAISTQGLFSSADSQITASSDFGIDGTVEINNQLEPTQGLVELSTSVVDASDLVTESCAAYADSSFTITGRGGLPPSPTSLLRGRALWLDRRIVSTQERPQLIEATNWKTHTNGQVELVSQHQAKDNIRASSLNVQASILLKRGQTQAALETWQKAAEAYQLAGDRLGALGAIINQAQALQSLGLYRRSQKLLEEINQRLENQPDTPIKAIALQSLGVTLQAVGELEKSQEILQQSLAISQQLSSDSLASTTLLNLGNAVSASSEPKAAIKFYQQAAEQATTPLEKTEALLNLLAIYLQEEQGDEVQSLLEEIEAEIGNIPVSRDGVYARVNLAGSLMAANLAADNPPMAAPPPTPALPGGRRGGGTDGVVGSVGDLWFDAAHHELREAIAHSQQLQDKRAEAIALHHLGSLYQKVGQLTTAQKLTEKSVLIAEGIQAEELVARSHSQLGRILKQLGKFDEAIVAYSNAVNGFESLRKDLVAISQDVQFEFRETVEPTYRDLVGLLLRDNPSQAQLKQAVDLIEALQLAELDNFFRDTCLETRPQNINEIDPAAAVIYPIILPDSLEIIVLQQNRPIRHHQIKLSQTDVEKAIRAMRNSQRITAFAKEQQSASAKLYDWLIAPFEEQLASNRVKTLVFVLDGHLRNAPMAALYDRKKEEYLVEKYAIALTPGQQLLKSPSLEPEKVQAFTGGVSESVQGFAALPAVEWELKKISELIPSQNLLNQEFTRGNLETKTAENPAPIVHLATHGQFSSNRDETFILAWDEKINVTEFERILRRRENPEAPTLELLVLSACQTASGDNRAALGLAGVAVRSGARSTLASLWSVQDRSTAQLIVEFYQQLKDPQISRAEALRRAQLSLLKGRYKPPYFWAPFVLVGNWQ